jgi:hypothetical protein
MGDLVRPDPRNYVSRFDQFQDAAHPHFIYRARECSMDPMACNTVGGQAPTPTTSM